MERYRNLSGNSGVAAFEIHPACIDIQFQSGDAYRYSYLRPGRLKVERMKALARAGKGLSTFIAQQVRDDYDKKLQ